MYGKIGRAETATDPAPLSMAETTIRLKPRSEWPRVERRSLVLGLGARAARARAGPGLARERADDDGRADRQPGSQARVPGWTNAWTAPVRARIDMMATGVRTPVGIRVVAGTPARLDALGAAVRAAVARVPGTRSAVYEGLGGETRARFELDPDALARHHVDRRARAPSPTWCWRAATWASWRVPANAASAGRSTAARAVVAQRARGW